jgi:selenocysteine lyase/cysteine desulfurase
LASGLADIEGVRLLTHRDPARSAAIVVFSPARADARTLVAALYEKERIVGAVTGSPNAVGARFSPHFYNTIDEIDRTIDAVRRALLPSGL